MLLKTNFVLLLIYYYYTINSKNYKNIELEVINYKYKIDKVYSRIFYNRCQNAKDYIPCEISRIYNVSGSCYEEEKIICMDINRNRSIKWVDENNIFHNDIYSKVNNYSNNFPRSLYKYVDIYNIKVL